MSSFADFALLAAIPSYGGAEILRAQRVLPSGAGPRVHLALFGRSDAVARRVVDVASVAANVEHRAIARILEVGRFDGIVYGVAEPAEGVDAAALLVVDKTRRRAPPPELALGIALAVSRVIVALHESGDIWAAEGAVGLSSVFPAGLGPDTIFLEPSGAVRLRVLAAAAGDPRATSAFRAPDAAPSVAADVYSLGRLLMALLAGDPSGLEAPRLSVGSPLLRFLPRLLDARPDDRPEIHDVTERLETLLAELNTTPEQAVQQALAGPYRSLVVDAAAGFVPAPRVIDDIRARLSSIYAANQRLFPIEARSAPLPTPFAALPPAPDDDAAVFTDARPAVRRGRAKTAATILIGDIQALAFAKKPGAVTSPTMIIPSANVRPALPAPAPAGPDDDAEGESGFSEPVERTMMIDPAGFVPFAPPPPGPARPPRQAPPPPPTLSPVGMVARAPPPSPSELSASAVQRPPALGPTASGPIVASRMSTIEGGAQGPFRTTDTSGARPRPPPPPPPPNLNEVFDDIFMGPGDDPSPQQPEELEEPEERTMIAPPATLSIPQGDTAKQPATRGTDFANASTRMPPGPPPLLSNIDESEAGEHTAIVSNVPHLSRDGDGGADDAPDLLDDGGSFEMVGEGGRTFGEDDNPFIQSTRMIPAQALQAARAATDEGDDDVDRAPAPLPQHDGATETFTAERMRELMKSAESAEQAEQAESVEGPRTAPTTEAPHKRKRPTSEPEPATSPSRAKAPLPSLSSQPPAQANVLIVDAPEGATVAINGKVVGTGKVSVDVDANARALVRVELAGFSPWSSVVQVQGRPRVRVRPTLKPKPVH